MAHLKRLLAPSFWRVPKKENKWVVAPHAGPHPKMQSIPLAVLLKHMLKISEITAESKKIIRKGEVFVDGKRRKDYAYPAGLFDVVSIPKINKSYRIVPSKKGLDITEISGNDANKKVCKIINKTVLKKGRIQLNLHDSKNILVENGNYKTGDSLLVELPSLKIITHLPLDKGNVGMISRGVAAGRLGKVKELVKGTMKEPQKIICDVDEKEMIIGKDNFVIIGKDKPVIDVRKD